MRKIILGTFTAGLLFSGSGICASDSSWLVRLRAIDVVPDASSSTISLIGGNVTKISDQGTGELDFSYFYNPNFAAELILATTRHSVQATNTALGTVNLGKVSVLPPTLTAQYHVHLTDAIKPYIGAGVNYTHFYNVSSGPVATSIDYEDSFGPAVQIGTDIALNDQWSVNVDIKKIWIKSDVVVYTPNAQLSTTAKINPWVFGAGVGYRFG